MTDLAADVTFIVSSHNLAELERMCSQVLQLEQGELKALQAISGVAQESSADKRVDYLTLRLMKNNKDIVNQISRLNSISKVDTKQDNEFIIHYDRDQNPILDQELLKLLALEKVPYRQITQGQSLEDQLFMTQSK